MKERKVYLDYIRITAAFLVIYNHTPAYIHYMRATGAARYLYMFTTMLTRVNVPLFFMVSGVLLLGRSEDIGHVLKRRLPKYLAILLILAAVYVAREDLPRVLGTLSPLATLIFYVKYVIAIFLGGGYINWFLYAYVGLLLMLPYLQRLAVGFTRQDFLFLLTLYAITTTVLPMVSMISPLSFPASLALPLTTSKAFFFALAGFYLDRNVPMEKLKPRHFLLLGLLSLLGILVSCACTTWQGLTTGTFTQDYVQLFEYITTISVFLLIKYLVTVPLGARQSALLRVFASLTFGVYLLDEFLRELLGGSYFALTAGMPVFVSSVLWCVLSMLLCGGATWLAKKLPVLRWLL